MSNSSSSTQRLFQAASALSTVLRTQNISHAFHGGFLTVLLGSPKSSEELFCIVEGTGNTHPFRLVRHALSGNEVLTATLVGWSNRQVSFHPVGHKALFPFLFFISLVISLMELVHSWLNNVDIDRLYIKYHEPIPPIEFEVLPAGEEGPRNLNTSRIMQIHHIPFLNITEFARAKLRAWTSRGSQEDAEHLVYVLTRYWERVDINRIPEDDMDRFVSQWPTASSAWTAIKQRYGG
ncbi:hypothetical protein Clacol_004842 [Clathrus columnatus]|uniref:Uncharacterized protein n=1 Tax=Clathrus columnatus TaxID=1419009 RepID=A0AAV5AF88_9AGAM|nr:hypothetical protein Clacol_004842 [Clathrus columnatus]